MGSKHLLAGWAVLGGLLGDCVGLGAAGFEGGQEAAAPLAAGTVDGPDNVAVLGVGAAASGLEVALGDGDDVSGEGLGDAGTAGNALDERTDSVVLHAFQFDR